MDFQVFSDKTLNESVKDGDTLVLGWYFPFGNQCHKSFFQKDLFSKSILDIKQDPSSIPAYQTRKKEQAERNKAYFISLFKRLLSENSDTIIAVLPSSNPEKKYHGMTELTSRIATDCSCYDGTKLLVRSKGIPSSSLNNVRDADLHQKSLAITSPGEVKGRTVLLIDDVTTSGASLRVGYEKFKEAGAETVICLALAKTVPTADYLEQETLGISPINTGVAQEALNRWLGSDGGNNIKHNRAHFQEFRDTMQPSLATHPYGQFSSSLILPFSSEESPSIVLPPLPPSSNGSAVDDMSNGMSQFF